MSAGVVFFRFYVLAGRRESTPDQTVHGKGLRRPPRRLRFMVVDFLRRRAYNFNYL